MARANRLSNKKSVVEYRSVYLHLISLLNFADQMAAPWRSLLVKSLETNKHLPNAKFMQLATVRPDGRPSVRTVVFRGFHNESDQVTFTTDTRCSATFCFLSPGALVGCQEGRRCKCNFSSLGSNYCCCRTYKVEDIQQHPWSEICWYFPETREQFRLGGNLEVVGEDHPDKSLLRV